MSKNFYNLSIDNPCGIDFKSMPIIDGKYYCNQCSKNVVDFSKMSDSAISILVKNSTGRVCGRLKKDQLNRDIIEESKKSSFAIPKIIASSLVLLTPKVPQAENNYFKDIKAKTVIQNPSNFAKMSNLKVSNDSLVKLKGFIYDGKDGKEPFPGVNIHIKGRKEYVSSNFDGFFEILLPWDEATELVFEYIGYEDQVVLITKKELEMDKFTINMNEENQSRLVGEIVIVKKKKWWQLWK